MWPYDSESFDPPAPVLEVALTLDDQTHEAVRMQVDSGADMTCIPEHLVPASGTLRYGMTYVSGYDGDVTMRQTFFVTIRFSGHRFENVEALPIAGEIGLIGRDLLNYLELTLDGPDQALLVDGR